MIKKQLFDSLFSEIKQSNIENLDVSKSTMKLATLLKDFLQAKRAEKFSIKFSKLTLPFLQDKSGISVTMIAVLSQNVPFLLDSLRGLLRHANIPPYIILHPIFNAFRKKLNGKIYKISITDFSQEKGISTEESLVVFILKRHLSFEEQKSLEIDIKRSLVLIHQSVSDWQLMKGKVFEVEKYIQGADLLISVEDRSESLSFLSWINENHFTFLGERSYVFDKAGNPKYEKGLGILKNPKQKLFTGQGDLVCEDGCDIVKNLKLEDVISITKTIKLSAIHRIVPMDMIRIKRYSKAGVVIGEYQFVGLFTSSAYSRSVKEIPLIRLKVDRVLEKAGFLSKGHDEKALSHIIETLPRDELFQYTDEDLYRISKGVMQLKLQEKIGVFIRAAPFRYSVTGLLYIPTDNYSPDLRKKIQDKLELTFKGKISEWQCEMGSLPFARLYFIINVFKENALSYDSDALEEDIIQMSLNWNDRFRSSLINNYGEEKGEEKFLYYKEAFPITYQDSYPSKKAVEDIIFIEKNIINGDVFSVNLYGNGETLKQKKCDLHIRLFNVNNSISLADIFPIMANLGLRVLGEQAFEIHLEGRKVWIHDFSVKILKCEGKDILKNEVLFEECLKGIWNKKIEDDRFNVLVLRATMSWRDVLILRALSKYLHQVRPLFNHEYVQRTLNEHSHIAKNLVKIFHLRLDPLNQKDITRPNESYFLHKIEKKIEKDLEDVKSLEDDRIFRALLNIINNIVRTTYYQTLKNGKYKPYVAFKFDSEKLIDIPLPKPKYEVFVYSPSMEAVHLRGGKVARGGIRWSDRQEDFRTEILGLVKAQMVKNSVIVPVGSKGGFIIKQSITHLSREKQQEEGIHCYKMMINAMLDLTDNIIKGKIHHPLQTVLYDDLDTYLVVAADKGTATFSDIANEISAKHNFWLGDAFASGGSAGYDHKKMGITAKGAWVSVERHFRELGLNIHKEDFTVVGVGDMSGDVFGNGMLCSPHIKLIGAFNHIHIFVDPSPDAKSSYKERKRLFGLPRSTWMDYNPELLSKGGAVYDRREKSVIVSPEVQKRLGLKCDTFTPDELIQAILRTKADLLWLGGIGTYIKAKDESTIRVGDKANNNIRIEATELNVRVVAEGANLGITQRGRIEFSSLSGHINTDAIDNSGGVDCSDHEVNMKILMQQLIKSGELTVKKRNKNLIDMEKQVSNLVLNNNYQQTQIISIIQHQGIGALDQQERFIRQLERKGHLNRTFEHLPLDEELVERLANDVGLYRPEIAVLLAYSKIVTKDVLCLSDAFNNDFYIRKFLSYFPPYMQKHFAEELQTHPLKKELIATILTNEMIDRGGITFPNDMIERSISTLPEIVHAFNIVCEVFNLRAIWTEIELLDDKVPAEIQLSMQCETVSFLRMAVLWFLQNVPQLLDVQKNIDIFKPAILKFMKILPALFTKNDILKHQEHIFRFTKEGVSENLSKRIVYLIFMIIGCRSVRIAENTGTSLKFSAEIYYCIIDYLELQWILEVDPNVSTKSYWEKLSLFTSMEDICVVLENLTTFIIKETLDQKNWKKKRPEAVVKIWMDKNEASFSRFKQIIIDFKASSVMDLSMLNIASSQFSWALQNLQGIKT